MLVGEVAHSEDRGAVVDVLDEPGGSLVALAGTVGDVTRRYNQHSPPGRVVAEEEQAINGNDDNHYDDHDHRSVERPQEPSRLGASLLLFLSSAQGSGNFGLLLFAR